MKKTRKEKRGLTIVYTGSGKGKTTAALGLIIRTLGYKKKAALIQFIKGSIHSGEKEGLKILRPYVSHIIGGKGFVGIGNDTLPKKVHKKAANDLLKKTKRLISSKKYFLVILDEINYAIKLKLIPCKDIVELIQEKPKEVNLVLTGNFAPKEVIDVSDLVTKMQLLKHPFQKKILAKKGIDF